MIAVPLVGLLTAVAAAWLSARGAARTPVAAALTGRRPPRKSSGRLLAAGVVGAVVGLAVLLLVPVLATSSEVVTAVALMLGTALLMAGVGATSPWLAERLAAAVGQRMPVGARLALRDAARFRSRTAPVVMAMVAGLGLSVAAGAVLDSISTSLEESYRPRLAHDQLLVEGPASVPLVQRLESRLPVRAAAPLRIVQPSLSGSGPQPKVVTIADPDLLEAVGAPPAATEALAAGEVLVLQDADGPVGPGDPVAQAERIAPDGVRLVDVGLAPAAVPSVLLSAETLDRLGDQPGEGFTAWPVALDGQITVEERQEGQRLAATLGQQVSLEFETGPPAIEGGAIQTVAVVGAGVLSLVIVGIGLALVAAETRRDEEVLATIGAAPGVRRGLAAARAGVLTLLGGVLAVPAGLLPVWGLASAADVGASAGFAVPWLTIAAVVLVVPAVAAAGAWLLTGSRGTTGWVSA